MFWRRKILVILMVSVFLCGFARASDPNMVAHWTFDEGSGTIAYDSAGTNNGAVIGASWTAGWINDALSFDGLNDYVNVGSPSTLVLCKD